MQGEQSGNLTEGRVYRAALVVVLQRRRAFRFSLLNFKTTDND